MRPEFSAFGVKYGNHAEPTEAKSYLKGTFGLFCGIHSQSIDLLKTFRDKIGAHSDSKANILFLPSHAEFEVLFNFANDFYVLVCRAIIGVSPAKISRNVGHGFIRLLELIGVEKPKFEFDEED